MRSHSSAHLNTRASVPWLTLNQLLKLGQPDEYKEVSGRGESRASAEASLPSWAPHHGTSSCCTLALRPRISPSGPVFLPPPCPHLCIVPAATFPHEHRDEM